jgi:hypothetical protein
MRKPVMGTPYEGGVTAKPGTLDAERADLLGRGRAGRLSGEDAGLAEQLSDRKLDPEHRIVLDLLIGQMLQELRC